MRNEPVELRVLIKPRQEARQEVTERKQHGPPESQPGLRFGKAFCPTEQKLLFTCVKPHQTSSDSGAKAHFPAYATFPEHWRSLAVNPNQVQEPHQSAFASQAASALRCIVVVTSYAPGPEELGHRAPHGTSVPCSIVNEVGRVGSPIIT